MVYQDFLDLLKLRRLGDDWWVAVDDTVLDSTMSLSQVGKLREELPEAEILLLHPADAKGREPEWHLYEGRQARARKSGSGADPETAKHLKVLESRVEFLQNTVDAILNMLAELDSFEELRKSLEERQSFIHRSEEELINRTLEFDEKVAEFEQRVEENT
ncbi:MAG: hypothetical protein ACFB21_10460 [Opitutales bacterium]